MRRKLDAGDYLLVGYESCCVIERKGSLQELSSNLFGEDHPRFLRAIGRLATCCTYPCLLIDASFSELVTRTRLTEPYERPPGQVLDNLSRLLTRLSISLLWIGGARSPRTRTMLGDYLIRSMLAHALEPPKPKQRRP